MSEFVFVVKDWENAQYRGRLMIDLANSIIYNPQEIARHFMDTCPNLVTLPRNASLILYGKNDDMFERQDWCAANTTGWWMNTNFIEDHQPDKINLSGLFKYRFAFESVEDAIIFKFTWGDR